MTITRAFVQSVRSLIAKDPAIPLEQLARTLDASEAYVIMALPVSMRTRARISDLPALWESLRAWENVSLHGPSPRFTPMSSAGGSECKGNDAGVIALAEMVLPPFCQEDIGFIWLVSQSTSGGESYSVRFFTKKGHPVLTAYLDEDTSGKLSNQGKASFDSIRRRFGVTPRPRMHCKGCGQCACGKAKHSHAA